MQKSALVTGVSTGIGRAIATSLAGAGWQVFGSVRNDKDAADFEKDLGGKATALIFDVTDRAAVEQAAADLSAKLGDGGLDLLVNNAGLSRNGPLQYLNLDDLRYQLEVNTIALFSVTQVFLPLLGAQVPKRANPGRIINISSVGGQVAMPFLGPYAASKFAVEALSDSFRRELMVYGIDVTIIQPGPIKTAIWEKINEEEIVRYRETAYGPAIENMLNFVAESEQKGLPAEAVGKLVLRILKSKRPKTRYVIQRGGPIAHFISRMLPDRLLDRLIAGQLGLT